MNENTQKVTKNFKDLLNKILNDKKIIEYFYNLPNLEKDNLRISHNYIVNNDSKKTLPFNYCIKELIIKEQNKVNILNFNNSKSYSLKCIIPIVSKKFNGSLIVLSKDLYITKDIEEAFFRFCTGLFFIIIHYITNDN